MGAPQPTSRPELSRDLGFFAVFATATGTMIGAGIFILPGIAAEAAGPGAALSFLFAGIIAGIAALSVSELATAMPKAGGGYYFVSRAMGPLLGTIVGLGAWLALVFKGSFALVGLGQYVLHFTPVSILAVALGVGLLLIVVNATGAAISGILQNIIVVLLLLILGLFVIRGVFAIELGVMRPVIPFGWGSVFATTGLVFISYLGIEKAAAISEEVRNPGKVIPRALLTSVALVTVLYVGVMLVVTGVLPLAEVANLPAPVAEAGAVFLGVAGGSLMAIAGLLATASTGNAAVLSSSRYPFAMARDGLASPWFNQIHARFRTPARAIWSTGAIMLVLVILFDVEALAKLGGVFNIFVFALVNLSVVILRRVQPDWYRPAFVAPFYPWLQIFGSLAALALIPQMGLMPTLVSIVFLAVGVGWYFWHVRKAGRQTIRPRHGLLDHLLRIRQIHSLEEQKRSIEETPVTPAEADLGGVVVELRPEKPHKHLLTLAASQARRYGCPVDLVVVTELPIQSPLTETVDGPDPEVIQRARDLLAERGAEMRFHHVVTHDRAQAILNFVDEGTHVLLLDWHDEFRPRKLRGSYMETILKASPARVGVLKYRGHRKYERLLVSTAGGPYARAEVELADAIAETTGATITLLMVVPEDASRARRDHAHAYLKDLARITTVDTHIRVETGEDVEDTIERASEGHDLIVLGASRRPVYERYLFGRIPERIAGRTGRSVLMTRDPGFPQLWPRRFARLFGRKRVATRPAPTPIELGANAP